MIAATDQSDHQEDHEGPVSNPWPKKTNFCIAERCKCEMGW